MYQLYTNWMQAVCRLCVDYIPRRRSIVHNFSPHADGERRGLDRIGGRNGKVSVRRVCRYHSDRHRSSAFAVGMLRDRKKWMRVCVDYMPSWSAVKGVRPLAKGRVEPTLLLFRGGRPVTVMPVQTRVRPFDGNQTFSFFFSERADGER